MTPDLNRTDLLRLNDRDLGAAYAKAQREGDDAAVDFYFAEIERRHAQQLGSRRLPGGRYA